MGRFTGWVLLLPLTPQRRLISTLLVTEISSQLIQWNVFYSLVSSSLSVNGFMNQKTSYCLWLIEFPCVYTQSSSGMIGSICRDHSCPFHPNNRKVVKEWNVSPGVIRLVSYHRPVKETRICHPQICLLDIKFILSHRQLIVLQNKTKQKQTKNKTRKTPPKPKPILILLEIDLSAQRWHQRNLQTNLFSYPLLTSVRKLTSKGRPGHSLTSTSPNPYVFINLLFV